MNDHCDGCAIPAGRRAFLRDTALIAASILGALCIPRGEAAAMPIRVLSALPPSDADRFEERRYPIPTADGVSIDRDQGVIIARAQNAVYAFSLACPHQNTALKWAPSDHQFQCPKHHSKYREDGTFIEGRATRGMDRFALRRDGDTLVVDVDRLYQEDENRDSWSAAVVRL